MVDSCDNTSVTSSRVGRQVVLETLPGRIVIASKVAPRNNFNLRLTLNPPDFLQSRRAEVLKRRSGTWIAQAYYCTAGMRRVFREGVDSP